MASKSTSPPTSIKVGHRDISVEFVDREELEGADGKYFIDDQRILVGDWLSLQTQAEVLLHELLHAWWPYRWNSYQKPADLEEDLVCAISPQLATTLRDNPPLVAWLSLALKGKEL